MKKRILIIATNQDTYGETEKATGLWLGELTHFYDVMAEAGFKMDIASPKGGKVPLDPRSLSPMMLDKETKAYHDDPNFMQKLEETLPLNDVDPAAYDAVYLTGGHGVMWDFPENEDLQKIGSFIYENGGIVSSVCHGSAGLLNITLSDGSNLIAGKELTGFSWSEERVALVSGQVPYNLEEALKKRGANFKKRLIPLIANVVVDGRLVTGQNPASARKTAEAVLEAIRQHLG